MPEITSCPQCERKLRVPEEMFGQQVKCPSCGLIFTAAAAGGPPSVLPAPASTFRDQPEQGYQDEQQAGPLPGQRPFTNGSRDLALSRLKAPAICLLITGLLGAVTDTIRLFNALGEPQPGKFKGLGQLEELLEKVEEASHGPVPTAFAILFLVISVVVIGSAIMMLQGKMRGLAVTGSILAMLHLEGCCCLLGLPVGIWSLVILFKPEVKDAFS